MFPLFTANTGKQIFIIKDTHVRKKKTTTTKKSPAFSPVKMSLCLDSDLIPPDAYCNSGNTFFLSCHANINNEERCWKDSQNVNLLFLLLLNLKLCGELNFLGYNVQLQFCIVFAEKNPVPDNYPFLSGNNTSLKNI